MCGGGGGGGGGDHYAQYCHSIFFPSSCVKNNNNNNWNKIATMIYQSLEQTIITKVVDLFLSVPDPDISTLTRLY